MSKLTIHNSNAVSSVMCLQNASAQIRILEAIYSSLDKEIQKMKNPINGGNSICTSGTNSIKTDSIKAYVAMFVKFNFNSNGSLLSSFTKDSIANLPNNFVESVINFLATHDYTNHEEVFKTTAMTMFGFDPILIDAALASNEKAKARLVYKYVASRFEMYAGIQPQLDGDGKKVKDPLDIYLDMYKTQDEFDRMPSIETINKLMDKAFEVNFPYFDLMQAVLEVEHE